MIYIHIYSMYVHVCVYVYVCACMYICLHVCVYLYMCVQGCMYMCVHGFVYVYKCVYVCIHVHMYLCTCVCVCICMQMDTTKMLKDMELILHMCLIFHSLKFFMINIHYNHYKNETRKLKDRSFISSL